MPKEDRRIIFSNDEVYSALCTLYNQREMRTLPVGKIITAGVDAEDPTMLFFVLENPVEGTHAKVEHNRDFVAAALMLFCRGCGVPLPRNSKKAVVLQDGTVILRVRIG